MSTHTLYNGKNTPVPHIQQTLVEAGGPVVREAPGVQIATDGIHWRMFSHDAVANLFQNLVERVQPTSEFTHDTVIDIIRVHTRYSHRCLG